MSLINFKFCPFCGDELPQTQRFKFCPFCGEKFTVQTVSVPIAPTSAVPPAVLPANAEVPVGEASLSEASQEEAQDSINTKSPALAGQSTESTESTEAMKAAELTEATAATESAKAWQGTGEIDFTLYNKANLRKIKDNEVYSIVLKHAPDKATLGKKLEQVLLRGSFAIRMALDNIPNIIVYKGKGNDVKYYNEIFIGEQASTSIIQGDFDSHPDLMQLFAGCEGFNQLIKERLEAMPVNFWVGEKICGLFPRTYLGQQGGITIITDKQLIFVSRQDSTKPVGFIRSFALMSKVLCEDIYLYPIYNGSKLATITFPDEQLLVSAYQCLKRNMS